MIKKNTKNILILVKSFYWRMKILKIPNGLFMNNEVKNINLFCKMKKFGAPRKEDYEVWKKQTCGIVSLKILTDFFGKTKKKSIYQMTKESMKFETFIVPEEVEKPEDIKGIFHKGLLEYAKSLGLVGFARNLMPLEKVIYFISKGWYFLASVNIYDLWDREWKNKYKHIGKGRHMVLVIGFKKVKGRIVKVYYKDCSTICKWNQETDKISYEKFKNNFNCRGIFLRA